MCEVESTHTLTREEFPIIPVCIYIRSPLNLEYTKNKRFYIEQTNIKAHKS